MINFELLLFKMLFYYLTFLFIVSNFLGERILTVLRRKDTLKNKVQPRLFGILCLCADETVFVLLLCLSIYGNVPTYTAFSAVISLFYGLRMVKLLSTRLVFEKEHIVYRTLFKHRLIGYSEIHRVQRIIPARHFGYSVKLLLRHGEPITLHEQYYKGLNHLWDTFGEKYDG